MAERTKSTGRFKLNVVPTGRRGQCAVTFGGRQCPNVGPLVRLTGVRGEVCRSCALSAQDQFVAELLRRTREGFAKVGAVPTEADMVGAIRRQLGWTETRARRAYRMAAARLEATEKGEGE